MVTLSNKRKIKHSAITRKLLTLCAVLMLAWAVFVYLIALLAYEICTNINWSENLSVYRFFRFIAENMNVIFPAVIFAGWVVIFCIILRKSFNYLDEITFEAEKLADPNAEQITLSDELKSVQDELNSARERSMRNSALAKEAEQRKNDLVVYLAHDLKTPLTSVIGYLTLLRDEPEISPETRAKYTGIALEKAERLEELVNEFFDITRFNLSKITLEKSTINLTLMLEQLVYEFEPILSQKGLTCALHAEENMQLSCDPDKLSRVFDNLLRNAANYSYEGTSVEISARLADNSAEISFKNKGATIPSDKLSRIFEQFFRLDSSRGSQSGGAGLGLAIAKQITELHGGTISAKSENEQTEFLVKIPLKM